MSAIAVGVLIPEATMSAIAVGALVPSTVRNEVVEVVNDFLTVDEHGWLLYYQACTDYHDTTSVEEGFYCDGMFVE